MASAADPGERSRRQRRSDEAERDSREARHCLSKRRARALQSRWLLLRPAGIAQAIEHYKKATELAPDYSTAYNILGYAYRQNVAYANAEKAFKKYIELIPNDPNPYDSYAELLLKMGRFDESITQYQKALAIDSNFINSHLGIAAALDVQGQTG